ncbi:MAG: response regulator [Fidelibacterota bacterium]
MIDVLVADDHTLVREGLKEILSESSDIAVAGEASNGREVMVQISKYDYDAVLLDISMPGRSGLEVLKDLKAVKPNLPVLMLSMHPEELYAIRALKAGASGYLTKDAAPDELIQAVRKICAGGRYVTASLAEKLAFQLTGGLEGNLHEKLSDRQYEIMCLIARGKTVSEIANELSLSVKTVSTHRARLLEKMGMKTNAEIMHYCIQNGLVD